MTRRSQARRRAFRVGLVVSAALHALPFLALVVPSSQRSAVRRSPPSRAPLVEVDVVADAPAPAPPARAKPAPPRGRGEASLAPRARRRPGPLAPVPPETPAPPAPPGLDGAGLTVFVDLARLKGGPSASVTGDIVLRVPAMSDLLRGTELDLYEAFDALVIASPDARSAPTFVAARYHVSEEDMRAALERGARAAGERLLWHADEGAQGGPRIAERTTSPDDAGASDAGAGDAGVAIPGAPVFVMAANGLVVLAPPAAAVDGQALLERMDASDAALGARGVALVSAEGTTRTLSAGELDGLWPIVTP